MQLFFGTIFKSVYSAITRQNQSITIMNQNRSYLDRLKSGDVVHTMEPDKKYLIVEQVNSNEGIAVCLWYNSMEASYEQLKIPASTIEMLEIINKG
jgi:hypothetical protein